MQQRIVRWRPQVQGLQALHSCCSSSTRLRRCRYNHPSAGGTRAWRVCTPHNYPRTPAFNFVTRAQVLPDWDPYRKHRPRLSIQILQLHCHGAWLRPNTGSNRHFPSPIACPPKAKARRLWRACLGSAFSGHAHPHIAPRWRLLHAAPCPISWERRGRNAGTRLAYCR